MQRLALLGGEPLRTAPFPAYNTIDSNEEEAVLKVLRSGKLSTFLGTWHNDFYGGTQVRALESQWADFFQVKHAISVNSATSGLIAAMGAIGIEPGDEVIVPAYSMSASATAPLFYGAVVKFADVTQTSCTMDVQSIKALITPKTKAIVVVDLFGRIYDVAPINALAKEHGLYVVEDCAQAPGAMFNEQYAGTFGDIGIYSLNYHKHIHSGEGGVVVCHDDALAQRIQLIRNHAEAVISAKGYTQKEELINMVGFNFRMTEIEAAIAQEQLKKLPNLLKERRANVRYLENALDEIAYITFLPGDEGMEQSYYLHAFLFNEALAGVSRALYIAALKAELPNTLLREESDVLLSGGYVKPLYWQPIFQECIAFGRDGYPFSLADVSYEKGLCPITERLHTNLLITHEMMRPGMKESDLDDVIAAFKKVDANLEALRAYDATDIA